MMDKISHVVVPEMELELRDILDYWMANALDDNYGGFVGEMSRIGLVRPGAEKGAVLNARLLWTFSAAYNFLHEKKYLYVARRAYNYLVNSFWDHKNGGLFWSLDEKGHVLNRRKQAYAQGFGIYGLSEYYRASGDQESLDKAIELYRLVEQYYRDEENEGYIEALDESWNPLEDMRLSLKDANEPKSMNTHLHIIEPYTNLYRVWPDAGLKTDIQNLIRLFRDRIIDAESFHFNLFFDLDWTVKSDIVSYGHDIEGAWLLTEAAHFIQDHVLLGEMEEIALKMVDVTVKEGLDTDGGLLYEKENGHIDTDKHWWPQAEALVGLLEAYRIAEDEKYLEQALGVWDFIRSFIRDQEYGEWHGKVNKNGQPYTEDCKFGFWKCPYHNSRALMEGIRRLKAIEE